MNKVPPPNCDQCDQRPHPLLQETTSPRADNFGSSAHAGLKRHRDEPPWTPPEDKTRQQARFWQVNTIPTPPSVTSSLSSLAHALFLKTPE